ncbi:MAG: phosphorylase family protein, partial [Candidatus Kariarchaeaceae archaeon]
MVKKRTKKTKKKDATKMTDDDGLQYHIKLKPGDMPNVVIMPGDPKRVSKIAKQWESRQKIAEYRQFVTYVGKYRNNEVAALSSGIGPPACEIAITELNNIGVNNIIRVGSCGSLREEIEIGELIISEAAV